MDSMPYMLVFKPLTYNITLVALLFIYKQQSVNQNNFSLETNQADTRKSTAKNMMGADKEIKTKKINNPTNSSDFIV